jgi:5-methylcytosine-specific restriction enzyme A
MNTPSDLEIKFHQRMLQIHEQAKAECGYNATRFLNMVTDQGGLQAAKALLSSSAYSEGLTRLWEERRLDISMEATILKEPWRSLFTPEELLVASKKLAALGYKDDAR